MGCSTPFLNSLVEQQGTAQQAPVNTITLQCRAVTASARGAGGDGAPTMRSHCAEGQGFPRKFPAPVSENTPTATPLWVGMQDMQARDMPPLSDGASPVNKTVSPCLSKAVRFSSPVQKDISPNSDMQKLRHR